MGTKEDIIIIIFRCQGYSRVIKVIQFLPVYTITYIPLSRLQACNKSHTVPSVLLLDAR